MNLLVLTCLLCFVVHGALGTQGSETTSSVLAGVTESPAAPASVEGLLSSRGEDELEIDEELEQSGGEKETASLVVSSVTDLHPGINGGKKKKQRNKDKKKNKHRSKNTTPPITEHTSVYVPTLSTTEDPCTSTHQSYCIHGQCNYIDGLQEPVCICSKGYDGERCGIQILGVVKTETEESSNTELVQTVLVIIAVVLSVISCTAVLLMTCAHYRSHKNFLASYLGTGTEQEKLQKASSCVV